MKPDSVRQSIRSLQEQRPIDAGPDIGRVNRMPGTGLPKGEKRKRKRGLKGKNNRHRRIYYIVWSSVLGLAALATLAALFFAWILPRFQQDQIAVKELEKRQVEPEKPEVKRLSSRASTQLVIDAMRASSPTEMGKYFYQGESKAQEILDFLKAKESSDGPIDDYRWLGNMDANELLLDSVVVQTFKDNKKRNRIAFIRLDEQQAWKIDFDSFIRKCEPSWQYFASGKVNEAMLRVYLAEDSFYHGFFSDDKQWVCYSIGSPDDSGILQAYCKYDSPQDRALRWVLKKQTKLTRVTLRVERPAMAPLKQVIVNQVIAEDWVISAKIFDTNF